jgi:predicted lipoprotein
VKAAKYILVIMVLAFVAYHSVYFKKLDEVKASKTATEFDPAQYVQTFWSTKLIPGLSNAIDITQLTSLLSSDTAKAFESYSHVLGIGNLRYFLVKGKGTITSIQDDDITVSLDDSNQPISIATEYIFGNAVRDATGLININEFTNTMDFNNVSAEINKIIREKVLPFLKSYAKEGNKIEFTGAIELNKEHLDLSHIEVVPIEIKTMQ